MRTAWDVSLNATVEMPAEMAAFLDELAAACRKYGLSLAHEDPAGSFLVQRYNEENILWLLGAAKDF